MRGPVAGDVRINGGDTILAAEIGGSVRARSISLKLLPGALIRGDLDTWGPRPPDIAARARVLGSVEHHAQPDNTTVTAWQWWWLIGFLALLVLGAATLALWRPWSVRVVEMQRRFGLSLLTGLIALVLIPLLAALLAASVIGIPLAVVVVALFAVVLLLSGVIASLQLGCFALARSGRWPASPYARLAVGALLLSLLGSLPWLGGWVWLLIAMLGRGASLLERRHALSGARHGSAP